MVKFEWDEKKNLLNIKKHKISFEKALHVFTDNNALIMKDDDLSYTEERFITLGSIGNQTIVVVVHTDRSREGVEIIRIISARYATSKEKRDYINFNKDRN